MGFICAEIDYMGKFLNFYIKENIPVISVEITLDKVDFYYINNIDVLEGSPFKISLFEFLCSFTEEEKTLILKTLNKRKKFHTNFYRFIHQYIGNKLNEEETKKIGEKIRKKIISFFE
ncbi:hypothetical protein FUSNEC_GEN_294_05445 [Fusobacterium necrophorum subsp. funduliforme]|uniref:Uncharacterized protein n=2 Tax=Fusobacterium necrophorum TaxID=859 RepID=A0A162J6T5_9FUSO|nr:hypothetical protein A2J07_00460 [Fusobacterium necrophorum subsp. funduliforme]